MSKLIDLSNKKIGQWTVLKRSKDIGGKTTWKCLCHCGKKSIVFSINLIRGLSKSCGCRGNSNLIGKKFGKLTVIKPTKDKSGTSIKWLCECECGGFKKVPPACLKTGSTKSCGCISSPDLSGKIFGKLKVLKRHKKTKDNNQVWICKCECGKMATATSGQLNCGSKKSCGISCLTRVHMAPIRHFYNSYKGTAKEYGRKFSLTIEEFIKIIVNPCFYCGCKGLDKSVPFRKARENAIRKRKIEGKKAHMSGRMNLKKSSFIANGIDRVNSNRGYVKNNCVPCCRPCNVAKLDRTQYEFIQHSRRIVNYQNANLKKEA
jgi:hypothetical protein